LFLISCLPFVLAAQNCAWSISGTVLDADTGEPMAFANIQIKETNAGAIADANGRYEIANLCEGTYTLVCTRVGCNHEEHLIQLKSNVITDFKLQPEENTLEKVTITAAAVKPQSTQATETISGPELASTQGLNLGESLKRLPGVTILSTGATIAKPMIQGLHSNRILILNNGVRQEGQQWGSEHAPEIDPFIADKVSVIKGASSVRYGADAIGGVILVEPRALPTLKGMGGEVNLVGFTNGRTGVASGLLQGNMGGKLPLAGRIQGTLKKGGNLQTPDYFLNNTGVEEYDFSWAVGLKKERFSTELFYSRFETKLGIYRGSHIGNTTDLLNAIERERPSEDGVFSYEIGRPQQRISHELFKFSSAIETGDIGKLSLQLTRQFNHRREYDAHRAYNELPNQITQPSIEFEITTHTADLTWEHKPIQNLRGDIGISFLQQVNTTDRGALIPNYKNYNGSAFWIERWKKLESPLELEAGVRYDYRQLEVGRQGQDTINQDFNFSNVSGTVGAIYRFPKLVNLRFNVGTAWRAPHVSELYSDGVHHGSATYEKGDANLQPERALNTSLTAELDNKKNFDANLTLYYNVINNYIFLNPQATPQLTIRGAFPSFYYQQANARLMGLDWSANYKIVPNFTLESRISLLRGWNRTIEDDLVLMPSDRFQTGLKFNFNQEEKSPFIRLTMTNMLEQTRVPANTDYAAPPAAYTLFDLEAGATFYFHKQPFEVGLAVFNLLDEQYREYLNRFRYYADELGRNVSLRLKVPFGVK